MAVLFGHFARFSCRSQTRAEFLMSGNEIFFNIVYMGGNSTMAVLCSVTRFFPSYPPARSYALLPCVAGCNMIF